MPSILATIMRIHVGLTLALCVAAACQRDTVGVSSPEESPPVVASGSPAASVPEVAPDGSCPRDRTVHVFAQANIFGAGIDEPPSPAGGGGGRAPACIAIPEGVSSVVVSHASGSASFTPLRAPDVHFHKCPGGREAILAQGPDGNPGGCPGDSPGGTIDSAGVVSGIASADRVGYLVGVFLPRRGPDGPPPATRDFEDAYDFRKSTPSLAQLFFIGDGRSADGELQRFEIPASATRLYLGLADAFGFAGPPGAYDDNHGSFRVAIQFG